MCSYLNCISFLCLLVTYVEESLRKCSEEMGLLCFGFDLPKDILGEKLQSAQLWLYKTKHFHRNAKPKLTFFEIDDEALQPIHTQIKHIAEGWIRFELSKKVKGWLVNNASSPIFKIECSTCHVHTDSIPISLDEGKQPLLVLLFETNSKHKQKEKEKEKRREKRSVNCDGGDGEDGERECCREKLYVSFKHVGWDSWVIQPEGYHAYFCTGSCTSASATASSASLNTSLRRKVFTHTKKVELIPCCAATHHSSMTLIYRVDNHTVTKKTLPNMVVESCGCL